MTRDLWILSDISSCYPSTSVVYLRGQAFLMLHDGNQAAAEFQEFIDPLWSGGQLSIGRNGTLPTGPGVCALGRQEQGAGRLSGLPRALWKDADPDIPILKQAKEEYAKLQ
jgi:hypothetical protein